MRREEGAVASKWRPGVTTIDIFNKLVGADKCHASGFFVNYFNMNPLNRVSLNLDGRREAKSNHGRFFGKDLTNVLQLNQASKQHDVRKRASSEYNQN